MNSKYRMEGVAYTCYTYVYDKFKLGWTWTWLVMFNLRLTLLKLGPDMEWVDWTQVELGQIPLNSGTDPGIYLGESLGEGGGRVYTLKAFLGIILV